MSKSKGTEKKRHVFILLPTVLIILGVIILLNNLGIISWGTWSFVWKLWPLLLVLWGLDLLLGRTSLWVSVLLAIFLVVVVAVALFYASNTGRLGGAQGILLEVQESIGELKEAKVTLKFGAGTMALGSLPSSSSSLIEGKFRSPVGRVSKEMERTGSRGILEISRQDVRGYFIGPDVREEWDLDLTPNIPLDLSLEVGAVKGDIDLRKLKVRDFKMEIGAGDATVVFPEAAGSTSAMVRGGVSNIVLEIPQGVGARIRSNLGVATLDLPKGRFVERDGYYVTNDFDSAQNKLDLRLDVGVSKVVVR